VLEESRQPTEFRSLFTLHTCQTPWSVFQDGSLEIVQVPSMYSCPMNTRSWANTRTQGHLTTRSWMHIEAQVDPVTSANEACVTSPRYAKTISTVPFSDNPIERRSTEPAWFQSNKDTQRRRKHQLSERAMHEVSPAVHR
jgi:hypothetical protein